jgi:hypothetical protein
MGVVDTFGPLSFANSLLVRITDLTHFWGGDAKAFIKGLLMANAPLPPGSTSPDICKCVHDIQAPMHVQLSKQPYHFQCILHVPRHTTYS